ncbi:MAG: hypothetical protein MUQ30_17585 [Anaerolineae bacterium]|nr:hypothetical protein [Anaerolineae bacterium]
MAENDYIKLKCPQCGATLPVGTDEIECEYCSTRLTLRRRSQTQSTAGGDRTRDTRFVVHICQDTYTGLPALRLEVPKDWLVSGGVTWVPNRPGAPIQIALQAEGPDGVTAFEIFPARYFVWMSNAPMGPMPGMLYFGSEVQMPVEPSEAITRYVLSRSRNIPAAEVVLEEPDPDWAQRIHDVNAAVPNAQLRREGIRMRIRYGAGQQQLEEELRAVVEYIRMQVPAGWMAIDTTYWDIVYAVGYRTTQEQWSTYQPMLRAIAESMELNPQWLTAVQQISQTMVQRQIQHINQIGDTARRIGQQYSEMSDMQMQSWQHRQDVVDRTAERYSEAIRGVDTYYDTANDKYVELPTGYQQAWTSTMGDYIISDDTTFDPNLESDVSWRQVFRRDDRE